MEIETLFYTSLVRDDLFDWQKRAFAANAGKQVARVDTWEIYQHPTPNGETFTLYACTIVLIDVQTEEGEMHRTGITKGVSNGLQIQHQLRDA